MDSIDLAYLAGYFDGEGSVLIKVKRWNGNGTHTIQCSVTSNCKESLDLFHEAFGGSLWQDHKNAKGTNKPLWSWSISAKQALGFLKLIQPFVKQKIEQVDVAICFQENKHGWDVGYREEVRQSLHDMKQNKRQLVPFWQKVD